MAISFGNIDGSSGTATVTGAVPMPTGMAANQVIISQCTIKTGGVTLAVAGTGWHLIGQVTDGTWTHGTAYHVCTGTSDGGPQWTWDGVSRAYASNTTSYSGVYVAGATPIGATSVFNKGSGTTISAASFNTTAANSWVCVDLQTSTIQTISEPTGFHSPADSVYTGATPAETMAHELIVASGSSAGAISVTITSAAWSIACYELLGGSPTVTESGTIAQTLGQITEAASGWIEEFGTVAQTLGKAVITASGWAEILGPIVQTLGKIAEHVAAFESEMFGTVTQTLGNIKETANGWVEEIGQIVQTLGQITQSVIGDFSLGPQGVIIQTFGRLTQSATAAEMFIASSITQVLGHASQAASGWGEIIGAVAQVLGKITQSVHANSIWAYIVQNLGIVKQNLTGLAAIAGQIVQMLGQMKQSLTGHWQTTIEEIGGIIMMLIHPLTQQAVGWMEPMGTIVQTLQRGAQTLSGWAEAIGHVTQILKPVTQTLSAVELTLLSLYYVSVDQLNAIVAKIERQIRKTWHGPPDDPLPPVI